MKIVVVLTLMLSACPEPKSAEEKKQDAEKSYGAELKACVDTSETRAQADECGVRVRRAWEIDGGVR